MTCWRRPGWIVHRVARKHAWDVGGGLPTVVDPTSRPLLIHLDATLVTSFSDGKEQIAGTYKGALYPPLAYLDHSDGVGEALAGDVSAGNAGANTADDHPALVRICPIYITAKNPNWRCAPTRIRRPRTSFGACTMARWRSWSCMRLSPPILAAIKALHHQSAKDLGPGAQSGRAGAQRRARHRGLHHARPCGG